eukprot:458715_1
MYAFLSILLIVGICSSEQPQYCLPSNMDCWPTQSEISVFSKQLQGSLILKDMNNVDYKKYINMTQNTLWINQYPSFISVCQSAKDIQTSVTFASSHNIQISIMSSGHSYSGKNTANYSLQINLSKMQKYNVHHQDPNNMSITVETGLLWGQIYQIVDGFDHRMVVGGSDPSVGPGGYTLGGGHSPLSPAYGMSSDFITEYYMVDAKSDVVHIYNTSGINPDIDELFWSLKGGGGSTFGVIVNLTFSMHKPEPNSVFTCIYCNYFISDKVFTNLFNLMNTGQLDSKWGGYMLFSSGTLMTIFMNYYGDEAYAKTNGEPIFHLAAPLPAQCEWQKYNTFYEYSKVVKPNLGGIYLQVFNNLIPQNNLTADLALEMMQFFNASTPTKDHYDRALTMVLISGATNDFDDDYTAVNPAFRNSYLELGMGLSWTDAKYTNSAIQHSDEWEQQFRKYGYGSNGAIYSNEENRECGNGCDYKELYWTNNHYNRLLKVKQKWDPNQVFWCFHCVGDGDA